MRISILAALLLPVAVGAQGGTDTTARPITLDEAVRMAQRNAPQAVQARGAIRSGESAVRSAFGSMLPSLSFTSSGTTSSGQVFGQQGDILPYKGTAWNFSRGLQSNLELFDGGRRLYNLRAARADVAAAEANDRLQRFNVALSVKQQYYNALAARESQAAARTQIEQAEQQLKASAARVAAGAATKSDSLRSVIQLQNARLALLTAQNDLRVANAGLTRLVATPFTVTPALDTSDSFSTPLDSAQLASFVDAAPAVVQASADLNAARAARRAARTPYMPTLSMSYSLNGSNSSEQFDFGQGKYAYLKSLRFNLQYPLFNQLQREDNLVRMSVAENNAEAALRDARFAAQQQMVQFAGALSLAEERVAIQVTTVAAAEEDLRVQQQRYSLGSSTLLDLLTSQTTLNQARTALIQARLDARVARAQIEALIGRDLR